MKGGVIDFPRHQARSPLPRTRRAKMDPEMATLVGQLEQLRERRPVVYGFLAAVVARLLADSIGTRGTR